MSGEYKPRFFDRLRDGARASAQAVAPLVYEIFEPKTVIDVGCGSASWAAAFAGLGAEAAGCDGAYALEADLDIPAERFVAVDLEDIAACRQSVTGRYDLAISLEVAEHLPEACADDFIDFLCALAPVTLFSAAIPGQAGYQHVNCQWPAYWNHKFRRNGRVCMDILRPLFFSDERIEVWYRQNMMLFVARPLYDAAFERLHASGLLRRALSTPMSFRHAAFGGGRRPSPEAGTGLAGEPPAAASEDEGISPSGAPPRP
jgi:hypothetical protein